MKDSAVYISVDFLVFRIFYQYLWADQIGWRVRSSKQSSNRVFSFLSLYVSRERESGKK